MAQEKLELANFSKEQLATLVKQVKDAQRGNDRTTEQLVQAAVSAIARSEAAAVEAKILTRFLTDM